MKKVVIGILLLLLTACAASAPRVVKYDRDVLLAQLAQLPGAAVTGGDAVQFSYPDGAMFGVGAVLPLPGGTGLLDPLADFFLRNPGLPWSVDVQVKTAHGVDYDQNLAEKRSELLATYLLSKGVQLEDLHFQPATALEESLVFSLKLPTETFNQ